jgi:hypothetical protein
MAEHRVLLEKWAAAAQLVELDRLNDALKEFQVFSCPFNLDHCTKC